MRLLLDAQTVIWCVDNPAKLGPDASTAVSEQSNQLLIGSGTIWEISIKVALGKLVLSLPFAQWIEQAISDLGAVQLPISIAFADCQMRLPYHHRDPIDRLLAAQAQVEDLTVISGDPIFDQYGVARLW